MAIARILFLWRIFLVNNSCIYKRVGIARLTHHLMCKPQNTCLGPVQPLIDTYVKYDLIGQLHHALVTGDLCHWEFLKDGKKQVNGI